MASRSATRAIAPAEPPEKRFYKIGEVAEIIGVQPYVLRYWETEFPSVKPAKARSQHRLYRPSDVDALRQIKELLYSERLTIEGAKRRLRERKKRDPRQAELPLQEQRYRSALRKIHREIQALHQMLA